MSKISIGVLGTANIAERFIIPTLLELGNYFDLKYIAGRSQEKANDFAHRFNCSPLYSFQELMDRSDIQAVYIPLPNSLHYRWVKQALLQDKHVLVEKSMGCTTEEVIELNEIAKERNLVLLENFQFRFHKQLLEIKRLIKEGTLGEIRQIRSAFGFPPFNDSNNIRYQKELGGGALLDAGAYPLKVAQEILDSSLYVDSASLFVDPNLEVDLWGSAQLKNSQNKVTVQAAFGFDNAYMCSLEIWGSEGILRSNRIFTSPPGVKAQLQLITKTGQQTIEIPEDNHFKNILKVFHSYIIGEEDCIKEYEANIQQAKLISQLKVKASE